MCSAEGQTALAVVKSCPSRRDGKSPKTYTGGTTREHTGHDLRPNVASAAALARIAAMHSHDQDVKRLPELRRILELEVSLQRHLARER